MQNRLETCSDTCMQNVFILANGKNCNFKPCGLCTPTFVNGVNVGVYGIHKTNPFLV